MTSAATATTAVLERDETAKKIETGAGGSSEIRARARAIHSAGGFEQALTDGTLPRSVKVSLSEALILGLLKQQVTTFFAIFGHGSTDIGNVLRIYDEEGVTKTINCRNEVEMAHAATALRWTYGETPAVITSIGPGALQALAGSLAAASNGVGVYHIYGDETTFGEGYNMQQVPKPMQGVYGRMAADIGESYTLHTPQALREALRRGACRVFHPYTSGPFYLLLPIGVTPRPTMEPLGMEPLGWFAMVSLWLSRLRDEISGCERCRRHPQSTLRASCRCAARRWRRRRRLRPCARPLRGRSARHCMAPTRRSPGSSPDT